MPISEEQLQEWARLAEGVDLTGVSSLGERPQPSSAREIARQLAYVTAIPALIAELREARVKLAESKSAYQPDSDHQSRYYVEQQGFWFWVVKCGTGTRTIFKSRTQIGAIEMAQELQTAFLDGEFVGQKAIPALTATIDTAVAPHIQKLAELEGKIEFQNNELVEKQKYILSLERKLAEAEKDE